MHPQERLPKGGKCPICSMPLPLWNRNQGRVAATEAAQRRDAEDLEARDLAIGAEIREARARVTSFAEVVRKTRGPAVDLG
jgi:hypothetical protein